MIRSLLLVPANRPGGFAPATGAGADAVAFDLRKIAASDAAVARAVVADALRAILAKPGRPRILLAIHALDTGLAEADLAALCPLKPDAILLPRTEQGADVQHLGALLAVEEAKAGFQPGALRIVALAESGAALFGLITLSGASPRLDAIAWDGEALGHDIGADETREPDGRWSDPCQTARTLTLAACANAKLPAIDSVFSGSDLDAFAHEAERARRDGFAAKICRTADQVAIVNAAFGANLPSAAGVARPAAS